MKYPSAQSQEHSAKTQIFLFYKRKASCDMFPTSWDPPRKLSTCQPSVVFQRQKTDAPIQLHGVIQVCGFQRLEAVNMLIMCAGKKKPCICGHSMLAFFLSINRPSLFQKGSRNQAIFADQEKLEKQREKCQETCNVF